MNWWIAHDLNFAMFWNQEGVIENIIIIQYAPTVLMMLTTTLGFQVNSSPYQKYGAVKGDLKKKKKSELCWNKSN